MTSTTPDASARPRRLWLTTRSVWHSRTLSREALLLALLVVEVVVLGQLSPYFLTVDNLLDTSRFFVEPGLIALGMTLVIITRGIDLSVGSLFALVSVCVGFSYHAGAPLPLALLVGLVVGGLGGLFNGSLIAGLGLSPLTVTIGTLALFRGVAYAVSNANAVSDFPTWFDYLGQFYFGGYLPGQLLAFAVLAVVVGVLLARTRFGRYLYAIGHNERATAYSGVSVRRVIAVAYVLVGLLVAVAAIIYTSRVSTARANAGMGMELSVIAAVVLGGTNIRGGSGTVLGTVLGVLILSTLQDGLSLAGVSSAWAQTAVGGVLLAGVFVNEFFRHEEE